jgi:hypothetical protein
MDNLGWDSSVERSFGNRLYSKCVRAGLLRHHYTYKSPGDLVKIQILIQKFWDKGQGFLMSIKLPGDANAASPQKRKN